MVVDEVAVSVENLSVSYISFNRAKWYSTGRISEIIALKDVSLQILHGDSVALLGKNGAGKSTLLSAIGGHLRPGRLTVKSPC